MESKNAFIDLEQNQEPKNQNQNQTQKNFMQFIIKY